MWFIGRIHWYQIHSKCFFVTNIWSNIWIVTILTQPMRQFHRCWLWCTCQIADSELEQDLICRWFSSSNITSDWRDIVSYFSKNIEKYCSRKAFQKKDDWVLDLCTIVLLVTKISILYVFAWKSVRMLEVFHKTGESFF